MSQEVEIDQTMDENEEQTDEMQCDVEVLGYGDKTASLSTPLTSHACLVMNKDIRKFLDGCYVAAESQVTGLD